MNEFASAAPASGVLSAAILFLLFLLHPLELRDCLLLRYVKDGFFDFFMTCVMWLYTACSVAGLMWLGRVLL